MVKMMSCLHKHHTQIISKDWLFWQFVHAPYCRRKMMPIIFFSALLYILD